MITFLGTVIWRFGDDRKRGAFALFGKFSGGEGGGRMFIAD